MSLLRDSGGAVILQLAGAGLQFVAGILLARWLLADGRGVFGLIVLIPETTRAIVNWGFGTASTRFSAKNPSESASISLNAISFGVFSGVLFSGVLLLFFPWLLEFVQGEGFEEVLAAQGGVEIAITLSVLSLPLLLLESFLGGQLVALRAILASNMAKVVQTGSFAAALWILFHQYGASVTMAVVARLLSFALGNLFAVIALSQVWKGPKRLSRERLAEVFRFGIRTLPASIAVFMLFRIDVALVRIWRPVSDVGIYVLASSLAMLFQVVGFAVERSLVPRIMGRSGEETKILTPLATRCFLWVGFPVATVAVLLAWPLLPVLFGEEFAPALLPFAIFLPGLVFGNVGQICNTDLLGRGFPAYASYSAAVALTLNIGLNIWLIPTVGIVGAAIASLVCYTLHGVILSTIYSKVVGVPLSSMLIPRPSDVGRIVGIIRNRS